MFPETKSRETLRFSGNKIHCSPRDQSLSVYCLLGMNFNRNLNEEIIFEQLLATPDNVIG